MDYDKKYRVVKLVNGLYQVQGKQFIYSEWDIMSWSSNKILSSSEWANNRDGYMFKGSAMRLLNKMLIRESGGDVAEVIWPSDKETSENKEKTFLQKIKDMF